uniref:Uncharacterized protein n=1 Tax=Leptobrachium leishanense TaxID=445787 RepID=A0A8C5LQE0_9ANUR
FLKNSVGIWDQRNSPAIISHLEVFEEALSVLGINSDAQKIEFIPWVFEGKHRYFFQSSKESGIRNWSKIVSEVKSEFGPHRTSLAAKRAILILKCRPNQSPREFLSVLKNAYSLAERNPNFENPEFIQLFYDALPNKIKVILARDYDPRNGLDCLLKESMTLFTVFEYSEETQGKRVKNSPEEIAETHVKKGDIKFESQKKSYAEIKRDSIPKREKSKPDQERGFARENSGSNFNLGSNGYLEVSGLNQGNMCLDRKRPEVKLNLMSLRMRKLRPQGRIESGDIMYASVLAKCRKISVC